MSKLRTHFTFRVDTWTPNGESIVEHVGPLVKESSCTVYNARFFCVDLVRFFITLSKEVVTRTVLSSFSILSILTVHTCLSAMNSNRIIFSTSSLNSLGNT